MLIRQSVGPIFKHAGQSVFNKGRYQITRRTISHSQRLLSPVLQGTQATSGLLFITRLLRVTPPVDNPYRNQSRGSKSSNNSQVNLPAEDQAPDETEPSEIPIHDESTIRSSVPQNIPLDHCGSETEKDLSDAQSNDSQKLKQNPTRSSYAVSKSDPTLISFKMADITNNPNPSFSIDQKDSEDISSTSNSSQIAENRDTQTKQNTKMATSDEVHPLADGHDTESQNKHVPEDTHQDISDDNNMPTNNNLSYDEISPQDVSGFQCPFSEQAMNDLGTDTNVEKDNEAWQNNTDMSQQQMPRRKSSVAQLPHNTHINGVPDLGSDADTQDVRHSLATNQNGPNNKRTYDPLTQDISQESVEACECEKDLSVNGGGDIVLVTGGSGFLGQHIVKMLQLRAPHVSEIWVLDLEPFVKKLDYRARKPVKSFVGSITDAKLVNQVLDGAHSVMHVAGYASWGTFPDLEGMERVNVMGTLNIFNACIKHNIQRLIYCSTVDVVVGNEPIRGGIEDNTHVPDKFLFPGYPDTKYHGERIVLGSLRQKTGEGIKLQTAILRANVCYGELDDAYVTNGLRMAHQSKGVLYQIGDGTAMFQQAYVGNTAWAFVCADKAMKENPNLSGEVFFIPDNTPVQNSFNFMRPYLEARGFKLAGNIPYGLIHGATAAAETLAKGLSPFIKLNLPYQSCTIAYINTDLYFWGNKAKEILNFEPIYSPNEARANSLKYYNSINLDEKMKK